jgi:hypothetical protein
MTIKLVETFAVNQLRQLIRESMQYHGEQAILLQMYHVGLHSEPPGFVNPMRCPDCYDDEYTQGERANCTLCYGTTFLGGIRQVSLVWGMFSDKIVAEQYGKLGTWEPDKREFQCEPFPILTEHDYVVRVRLWDATNTTPLEIEGYYGIQQVTNNSVRTGGRFGQWQWDIVGQRAQITGLQGNSVITQYPVVGVAFTQPIGAPSPVPVAVQGGQNVVFVQTGSGQGGGGGVFNHVQSTPAAVWTIIHNLTSPYPDVNIVVNGEKVDANVSYPEPQTVLITFGTPQVGTAELTG